MRPYPIAKNWLMAAVLAALAGGAAAQTDAGQENAGAPPPDSAATIAVTPREDDAAAVPPAADAQAVRLDEVLVTAQKRVESLQATPISIEAFNAEKLEFRGIGGLADLASNVPSMTIEPFPTHNATLRLFIRGVGVSDAQVTQDPAVGVYVDGIYIARSVGLALDIADLERIEVLRGPQGTLYGRNTTGGAINLITRRPAPGAFSMTHQLTLSNRNGAFGKSSFNLPLGDTLAFKLALLGNRRDGFVENTGPGADFGDRRETALRLDGRWLASDWLTADYSYDRTDTSYINYMFQAVLPPETNHGLAEYFKTYAQASSVFSPKRLSAMSSGSPMQPSGSKISGHALTLAAPLAGGYELKYIGSYRRIADDEYANLGGGKGEPEYRLDNEAWDGPSATTLTGGPVPLMTPQVFQSQWSHELQFSGNVFDETLRFIVGGYQFREDGGENARPVHHVINTLVDPVRTAALFDSVPGLHDAFLGLVSPRLVVYWDYLLQIHNTAKAWFGQTTWSPEFFDRRLHLTVGARQSWDERGAIKDYVQYTMAEGRTAGTNLPVSLRVPATGGNDDFSNVHANRSYSNFSPSFNLQYDLREDATLYLSSARAYKSGGFNVRDPQISGASGPASDGTNFGFGFVEGFAPEKVHSYEAGIKSEWLGRRLRINADVFDSRYTNQQINFLIPGTISDTKARNVGKSRMRGFELDTTWAAARGLIFSLDYAFLDARVLDVRDFKGDNVANLFPFISAPPHSFVTAVDWTFLQREAWDLRAYLDYHYVGHRNGLVISEPRRGKTAIDPYGMVNARLVLGGLHFGQRGVLDVALWGKNLADKEYELTAIDNLPQADRAVIWGEPRSAGLDLIYRYF